MVYVMVPSTPLWFKIASSVVPLLLVFVVNLLTLAQAPPENSFGNKPMLIGVTAAVRKTVPYPNADKHVTAGIHDAPSAPVRIVFAL
jgi:hypothetical protein